MGSFACRVRHITRTDSSFSPFLIRKEDGNIRAERSLGWQRQKHLDVSAARVEAISYATTSSLLPPKRSPSYCAHFLLVPWVYCMCPAYLVIVLMKLRKKKEEDKAKRQHVREKRRGRRRSRCYRWRRIPAGVSAPPNLLTTLVNDEGQTRYHHTPPVEYLHRGRS